MDMVRWARRVTIPAGRLIRIAGAGEGPPTPSDGGGEEDGVIASSMGINVATAALSAEVRPS